MRAIVSSDRPPFNELISLWLAQRQANVDLAESLEELTEAIRTDPSRLAVIWSDDGYRAISAIRRLRDAAINNLVMVVMPPQASGDGWSDEESSRHRAIALRAGADDAQTWPLAEDEFIERCRAMLRRDRDILAEDGVIRFAGCEFVPEISVLRSPAGSISLTSTETAYMVSLTRYAERVVTDDAIALEVYGCAHHQISRSLIKVFVHRLRKRIFVLTDGLDFLETVWGRGYRFIPEGYRPTFNKSGQRVAG